MHLWLSQERLEWEKLCCMREIMFIHIQCKSLRKGYVGVDRERGVERERESMLGYVYEIESDRERESKFHTNEAIQDRIYLGRRISILLSSHLLTKCE